MQQGIKNSSLERHTEPKCEKHLLIDGNSLFKRCFSIDKRISGNGMEWGGVYQFLMQVKLVLHQYDFDYVCAFFDGDQSGYLRYKFYKDYKANRDKNYEDFKEEISDYDKQIEEFCKRTLSYSRQQRMKHKYANPVNEDEKENFERQRFLLIRILEELFIRNCRFDMVEGDDLIAYYVKHKKPEDKVVIMTGDMDLTQLISDTVIIYCLNSAPGQPKYFINSHNSVEKLGFTHKNVALIKTICGDKSDNIEPISGFGGTGHKTLFKFFPELITEYKTLYEIEKTAEELNKAKPSKFLENLIEHRTVGNYDGDVLEINDRLVNLDNPILTQEAIDFLDDTMYAPIDPEGRDFKNIKQMAYEGRLTDWLDDGAFGRFFADFTKTIDLEKKRYKASLIE